jgi:hypothetical protein
MVQKPVLLPFSDNEVTNLVDHLNGAIQSHCGFFNVLDNGYSKKKDFVSEWIWKYFI